MLKEESDSLFSLSFSYDGIDVFFVRSDDRFTAVIICLKYLVEKGQDDQVGSGYQRFEYVVVNGAGHIFLRPPLHYSPEKRKILKENDFYVE